MTERPDQMPVLAVGRCLDVRVRADPVSCQVTATQLARLGETCGLAGDRLDQHARVDEDHFGGLSGIVYRQSASDLAALCHRLARDCARLTAGLEDYARDVAEVRELMGEAGAVATPHLRTTDDTIWSPDRTPGDAGTEEAWTAWHRAVDWWRRARALEDAAERAWWQVVQRHAPDGPVAYEDDEPDDVPSGGVPFDDLPAPRATP